MKTYRMECARCGRELDPWPLGHKLCSPKEWKLCISTDPKRVRVVEVEA